jgi:putative methionine-R-sulfoxide reductase with GAF domain
MRVALPMPARKKASSQQSRKKPFRRDPKCRALQEIGATIVAGGKGHDVVEEIAELVQRTCKYRWVGVYKIKRKDFVIEAATNKMKPACPRFPIKQGLSAKALEERRTVMVPDVSKEPCFLPNFWSTKSEVIVPIIDDEHDRVLGVINVESAKINAFDKSDRDSLEGVARIIWRALR